MVEGQHRWEAMNTTLGILNRLPKDFFSHVHFCSPFDCESSVFLLDDKSITCHHAAINDIRSCDKFVLRTIPTLVHDDHFLIVHRDGFPINPAKWTDEFLEYDYIGAPWCWADGRNNVGCGGFCIRSTRLAKWIAKQDFQHDMNEDEIICHRFYDKAVAKGFKFAPVGLAAKFSLENQLPDQPRTLDDVFGFHGKMHLREVKERTKLERKS